jgi:hypothetical protein
MPSRPVVPFAPVRARVALAALIALAGSGCAEQGPTDTPQPDRTFWRVRIDGSGDFGDIQDAVNTATTGDTIAVGPGHYTTLHEGIVGGVPRIAVVIVARSGTRHALTIFSEAGPESTLIGDVNSADYAVAFGGIDSGSFSGFEVRGGGNKGILVYESGVRVEGNRITGSTDGIRCEGGAPTLHANIVSGNGVGLVVEGAALTTMANRFDSNTQRGVTCALGTRATLVGDTLIANGSIGLRLSESEATADGLLIARGGGDAISLHASELTLRGSTIVEHAAGSGIVLAGASQLVAARVVVAIAGGCAVDARGGTASLSCCDLWGASSTGSTCLVPVGGGNVFADPLFCSVPAGDYGLRAASPCAPAQSAGCELIGAFAVSCD